MSRSESPKSNNHLLLSSTDCDEGDGDGGDDNGNGEGNDDENGLNSVHHEFRNTYYDDTSTVSALTFDHSHFDPIFDTSTDDRREELPTTAVASTEASTERIKASTTDATDNLEGALLSSSQLPRYPSPVPVQPTTAPHTPKQSNHDKSARLSYVHEKVISIQKENKNLKEANLRLMLQISTAASNTNHHQQKQQNNQQYQKHTISSNADEETTRRLTKIFEKVQEVQHENKNLKNENMKLRAFIQSAKCQHHLLLNNNDNSNIINNTIHNNNSNNSGVGILYSSINEEGEERQEEQKTKSYTTTAVLNNTIISSSSTYSSSSETQLKLNLTTDAIAPTPNKLHPNLSTDAVMLTPPPSSSLLSAPLPEKILTDSFNELSIAELEKHKEEYIQIKQQLRDQQMLVLEFLEKGFVCQRCSSSSSENVHTHAYDHVDQKATISNGTGTGTDTSSQTTNNNNTIISNNKENVVGKKKRRGLLSRRSNNKKDDKIQELTQKVTELENKLHKSQIIRGQDVDKITQLGTENVEQRTQIMYLERKMRQSKSIISNLEQHIETTTNEITDLKELHFYEKEELQNAYDDLKEETSSLVNWLKDQLSMYQGKSEYEREIALAEDESLESLTKSERETLAKEIKEERQKWSDIMDAPVNLFDFKLGRGSASESASIGASTLTTRSPI